MNKESLSLCRVKNHYSWKRRLFNVKHREELWLSWGIQPREFEVNSSADLACKPLSNIIEWLQYSCILLTTILCNINHTKSSISSKAHILSWVWGQLRNSIWQPRLSSCTDNFFTISFENEGFRVNVDKVENGLIGVISSLISNWLSIMSFNDLEWRETLDFVFGF